MKNFTFNKEEHYYELDGKRMYGITTILGVIAKPALIQWAANMVVEYVMNIAKQDGKGNYTCNDEVLKEARYAHKKKKESAGEKGTDTHSLIEDYIKLMIADQDGIAKSITDGHNNPMVEHFIQWAVKNKIKFLVSEKQLYSESAWTAGTCDMTFEQDGKKYVGDIKTSSAIYPEHFYQMAAYRMMLEEMGETDFVGSAVIRIGKDGKFNEDKDVKYRYDHETDLKAFLGALAIFKAGETYKQIK